MLRRVEAEVVAVDHPRLSFLAAEVTHVLEEVVAVAVGHPRLSFLAAEVTHVVEEEVVGQALV